LGCRVLNQLAPTDGKQQDTSVYLPAWSLALIADPTKPISIRLTPGIEVSSLTAERSPVPESPVPELPTPESPTPGYDGHPAPSTNGIFVQDRQNEGKICR